MKDATLAPAYAKFDYIVIGGGTCGCALAATLSQNANVLVLERGGSPYENPSAMDMENFANTLFNVTPNSWSQPFVSEDGVYNTRARVLGGDSVLNAGFYSRAEKEYLEMAEWDVEEVYAAYEWVERDQRPKAYGVIYQDADGLFHRVELAENVMNEVILSAGALGSPQLLMLSGVGPRAHLEAHGVNPVVLDHPMVGQGMGDNAMNSVIIPSPKPVEMSLVHVVGITRFDSFIEGFSGLTLSTKLINGIFCDILNLLKKTSLSTQSIIKDFYKSIDLRFNLIEIDGFIFQKIDGPVSRGYLELKNTNPDDNPLVTFNYYQAPEDLDRCVKGLETIIKVVNSNAFSDYKYPDETARELLNFMLVLPTNLRPRHVTALFNLTQYCIDTVMTIWHYHGGCQVGRVVDQNYKVFGIDGLRVIDGSTFLKSPGTNPQATVMMLGRYMGKKILQERVVVGGNNEDETNH
ncbi:unnamed protein product [Cochlearia groenlandica]